MRDLFPPGERDALVRRRFEVLYGEQRVAVLAYVLRRTDSPDDVADVVAETFLVAWRRLDDAPAGDRSRLWLYGIARRVLANHRRGERRRIRLADRLREDISDQLPTELRSSTHSPLASAFRSLGDDDRELLALHAWEGLDAGEITAVVGCSRNAARIRLHRARRQLRAAIAAEQGPRMTAPGSGASSPVREPQASPRDQLDRHERASRPAVAPIVIKGEPS